MARKFGRREGRAGDRYFLHPHNKSGHWDGDQTHITEDLEVRLRGRKKREVSQDKMCPRMSRRHTAESRDS